ncbi:sigma-E processing peptidase SpoIIGA [Staphylospora marina]|uniref:sigma-E processing peptidase SpoIIGA n=1 Tax=Staphylospora marina TaxID=2490858 RepID=UPI0013DDCD46|nr:sigma-E processing peptidase SpoIIGA [Staphylospora marina]
MIVYADLIFLLNACIDFLLLWLVAGIRKQTVSLVRLALAALTGGLYSMLYLWPEWAPAYFLPVKLSVSVIMVWIAYGFRHPVSYLRNLGMFYLACFIAGGAMVAAHYILTGDSRVAGGVLMTSSGTGWGSPVSWGLILIGFPLVWAYTRFSLRSLDEQKRVEQFLLPLNIKVSGKELELTGFVDTGNQLRDPFTRSPVIMVELSALIPLLPKELIEVVETGGSGEGWNRLPGEWMTRVRMIPFRAAGNRGGMLVVFRPDEVSIFQGGIRHNPGKILIGIDVGQLSSDGTYQAIIHPSCLGAQGEWNGNHLEEANA